MNDIWGKQLNNIFWKDKIFIGYIIYWKYNVLLNILYTKILTCFIHYIFNISENNYIGLPTHCYVYFVICTSK